MEIEEVKSFIEKTTNKLSDNFVETYIIKGFDVPMLIHEKFNYEYLKKIHFQTILYINDIKNAILNIQNDYEFELKQLTKLKLIIDNLIKQHPKYTKVKFEKHYENLYNEYYRKGNALEIKLNKKLKQIMELYSILIKNDRIDKNQRKAFISLFFNDKPIKDKILWKAQIYDLRAFLNTLKDIQIIKADINIDDFAPLYFNYLSKRHEFKEFDKNYSKSLQNKPTFFKASDFWKPLLLEVFNKKGTKL